MKLFTYEQEKKITQDILKLLDGVPYMTAEKILDEVKADAYRNSYVDFDPKVEVEVNLSTKKIEELSELLNGATAFIEKIREKYLDDETNEKSADFEQFTNRLQKLISANTESQ